ncbi:hypothetical protein HUS23_09845 [Ectothiorhodospiraceae bacterium 2226]|nr:hypothetical protein HUS23_09845 [Ectothiorhodospiraceae bacterium 2226]
MDADRLNERCVKLMESPGVKARMWHPAMFWEVGKVDNPRTEDLVRPKVDLDELEVLLSVAAGQRSMRLDALNERWHGRGDFLRRMVQRGDMPLLSRVSG